MKGQAPEQGFDLHTGNGVTELEAYVQCRLGGQVRDFRVVVTDRGLILRGQARTYHAKQLAQHAVMEATALPIVANEIEVA
jgi:osmotically-inducible protein OsmY